MKRTSTTRAAAGAAGIGAALVAVAVGASSYPGCAVYSQSLIGASRASDTGPLGDDDGGSACMPATWPSRPGPDAAGTTNIAPIVAAFRTIDIGVSGPIDGGVPPFGYDLDNTCTCPGPPSCLQRSDAGGTQDCDDKQGRDNLDIQLFQLLRGPATTGTTQIDQGLAAGQFGLLLVIRNYNGTGDDPQVTVEFYLSNGLERDADGGIPAPKFDGTDRWTIDPGSLVGQQAGAGPAYYDDTAYVAGNTVVARNFSTNIPIAWCDGTFLGGATMLLSAPIIVGTLAASNIGDGGPGSGLGFALTSGTIAGRWPTPQILSTLAKIPVEGGTFICPSESQQSAFNYALIKNVVCGAADISSTPQGDNNVPLAPCDAISVGMQFTAVPAQLGDPLMVPPPPSGCKSPTGVAFMDTCSQ